MRTTVETWREGAHAGHTHEPNEVTIQLDGLGRQLSELLPEPAAPEGSEGPVFVDESGRRGKSLRRLGWVLAALFLGYAVTLVVAVLGGSSSAPFLPLSGQEEHRKTEEVRAPVTPGQSPEAQAPPATTPGASLSATPQSGGSRPVREAGADSASPPASGPSAPTSVVPSAQHSGTGSSTAGGAPGGEAPASAPAVRPGTPSADPTATPPDPVSSTATTPDPPVQEQEGAN